LGCIVGSKKASLTNAQFQYDDAEFILGSPVKNPKVLKFEPGGMSQNVQKSYGTAKVILLK
jgi:hypothetical protein